MNDQLGIVQDLFQRWTGCPTEEAERFALVIVRELGDAGHLAAPLPEEEP